MANSNIDQLKDWLRKQLDETYDDIRWCETHNTPANEERVNTLLFRKAWIQTELNNIYYTKGLSLNK